MRRAIPHYSFFISRIDRKCWQRTRTLLFVFKLSAAHQLQQSVLLTLNYHFFSFFCCSSKDGLTLLRKARKRDDRALSYERTIDVELS